MVLIPELMDRFIGQLSPSMSANAAGLQHERTRRWLRRRPLRRIGASTVGEPAVRRTIIPVMPTRASLAESATAGATRNRAIADVKV